MAEIHDLILARGRAEAVSRAGSRTERVAAEIAATILSEESSRSGFTYAGFCLTALPHRALPDDQSWVRQGHKLTLVVDPGTYKRNGTLVKMGVPYGSRARLILIYLQTQAVLTNSPEVELGNSMRSWLSRMGISSGGKTFNDVREQCDRISACNLSFFWGNESGGDKFAKSSLVTGGIRLRGGCDRQGELWSDTVRLSDEYYKALRDHPVPILESAIQVIGNKSMAIDVYIWLAYRLHSLSRPTPISWDAVKAQFGAGMVSATAFRQAFKETLKVVLAAYPDAKVDVVPSGLILHQSRPPIERASVFASRPVGRVHERSP